MKFPPLVPGRFVRRVNRFRVTVTLGVTDVDAHLPNSGRLTELLTAERPCWLQPAGGPHRKTDFDLKLMAHGGVLVSVDARLPNPLFAEALTQARLEAFEDSQRVEREVMLDDSRLDFRLRLPHGNLWVETKSVTLVEEGLALFPDAPTRRGTRHLRALADAVRAGDRSAVVFIVQRPDARAFAPHGVADPHFAATLRQAVDAGVGIYAWTCSVSRKAIALDARIPVVME